MIDSWEYSNSLIEAQDLYSKTYDLGISHGINPERSEEIAWQVFSASYCFTDGVLVKKF